MDDGVAVGGGWSRRGAGRRACRARGAGGVGDRRRREDQAGRDVPSLRERHEQPGVVAVAAGAPLRAPQRDGGSPGGRAGRCDCARGRHGGSSVLDRTRGRVDRERGRSHGSDELRRAADRAVRRALLRRDARLGGPVIGRVAGLGERIRPAASAWTGWMPDALLPVEAAPSWDPYPMNVAAQSNSVVWIDVTVPATQAAGTYTGTIAVAAGGSALGSIPVTLDVMGATLPDAPAVETMLYYDPSELSTKIGDPAAEASLWKLLHRHRLSAMHDAESTDDVSRQLSALNGFALHGAERLRRPGRGTGRRHPEPRRVRIARRALEHDAGHRDRHGRSPRPAEPLRVDRRLRLRHRRDVRQPVRISSGSPCSPGRATRTRRTSWSDGRAARTRRRSRWTSPS